MKTSKERGRTVPEGLRPTDLVTVVCGSDVDVSSLMLSLTVKTAVEDGLPVALFSPEMEQGDVALNLVSAVSGIDFERIRAGLILREDWPVMSRAAGMIAEASLFVDRSPQLPLKALNGEISRLKEDAGR